MRKVLTNQQVADLIERFLNGQEEYPQEWNDFIEAGRVEQRAEGFRERCYELDPLVNTPEAPNDNALAELHEMVRSLREM
jgi:hypothetical protein